jgi:hypothetical protein
MAPCPVWIRRRLTGSYPAHVTIGDWIERESPRVLLTDRQDLSDGTVHRLLLWQPSLNPPTVNLKKLTQESRRAFLTSGKGRAQPWHRQEWQPIDSINSALRRLLCYKRSLIWDQTFDPLMMSVFAGGQCLRVSVTVCGSMNNAVRHMGYCATT